MSRAVVAFLAIALLFAAATVRGDDGPARAQEGITSPRPPPSSKDKQKAVEDSKPASQGVEGGLKPHNYHRDLFEQRRQRQKEWQERMDRTLSQVY